MGWYPVAVCAARANAPREAVGTTADDRGEEWTMIVDPGRASEVAWETDVSLLTNPLIVRQLAFVVVGAGLIMALFLGFIFAATGEFDAIPPMLLAALLTTAGFGLLLLLITVVVFGGRMRVRFVVDERGVLWETVDRRAIRGSRLALLAGVLARSPQTAGAGALAAANQRTFVAWQDVRAVDVDQRRRTLTLRNSWRPTMLVVCTADVFADVRSRAETKVSAPAESEVAQPPRRVPLRNGLIRTVLVAAANAPLFALSSSIWFELDLLLPIIVLAFALATTWLIPLFGWVVLGCGVILAAQITWIGVIDGGYLPLEERVLLALTYLGLVYLAWFSWASLRGRLRPPLLED